MALSLSDAAAARGRRDGGFGRFALATAGQRGPGRRSLPVGVPVVRGSALAGSFGVRRSGLPAVVVALYQDMRSKRWISFNGGEAFVTSTHPVSTSRGFVPAGEVVLGDVLHREDDLSLGVAEVSSSVRADLNINVETEDHRPFYVNAILFGSYPSYPPSGRN